MEVLALITDNVRSLCPVTNLSPYSQLNLRIDQIIQGLDEQF